MLQLSANFANLQLEYDNAQDSIESLKKEVSTLTKDLKATVEKATEAKETLMATQSELSLEQSKNASLLANSTQLNEQLVNLQTKAKEQVIISLQYWTLESTGSQCGNFIIFPSLMFCLKSILEDLEVLENAVFSIFGVLNFVNLINISYRKVMKFMKSNILYL